MNILTRQAYILVKDRWFDIPTAVSIAYWQQKAKWFIDSKWRLTQRGIEYWKLTSETRDKVRRKVERWASWDDFTFYRWKAIYVPDLKE